MTELQKRELQLLNSFDTLCLENGLDYYAVEGTMLGAARHQGFIPWDDDIDVALPRPDYEKLKLLFGNKRIGDCFFETPELDADNVSDLEILPLIKVFDIRHMDRLGNDNVAGCLIRLVPGEIIFIHIHGVIVEDILGLDKVIAEVHTTHSGESNVYGHGFADYPGLLFR